MRYEYDERGVWAVFAEGVKSGHSAGRSVREARANIREAVALVLDIETEDVAIGRESFDVPSKLAPAVADARVTKVAAEKADRDARVAQDRAVKALRKAGLTMRDIGELLGISFQRVQQIAGGRVLKVKTTRSKSATAKKVAARKGTTRARSVPKRKSRR